jgi:hypothetical protein
MRLALGFAALAVFACQSGAPPPSKPPVAVTKPDATEESPPNPPAHGSRGSAFPPSALTDFANGITSIVIAVLEGRAPPDRPIPIERVRDPSKLVRAEEPIPPVQELEFFLFALEVDIIFTPPAPPPGTTAEAPDNGVRSIAFLSRTGLKVARLRPSSGNSAKPVPAWLAGVEQYAKDVHSHLRSGQMSSLLVGDAERPVVGNDALFREIMEDQAKPADLRVMEEAAKKSRGPIGVRADDVILVARHPRSSDFYGFKLNLDEVDDVIVLDSAPLMRVQKFEPRSAGESTR